MPAVKVRINRIETKLKKLRRNKQRDKLHELSSESFFGKHQDVQHEQHPTESQTVEKGKAIACTSFDSEVLISVNQKLAVKLATVKDALEEEKGKTDELSAKLSKLSIQNTNKKLRRRDDKIVRLKEKVKMKNKVEDCLKKAEIANRRCLANLFYARKKCKGMVEEFQDLSIRTQELSEKAAGLQAAPDDVESERDSLLQQIEELESHTFETKEHKQKYLDNVRQCCIELLGMNVGISNVEPIIRCVLKHIASLEVKELPHTATLVRMLTEMKGLAYQQLSEELSNQENLTLHSDGIGD